MLLPAQIHEPHPASPLPSPQIFTILALHHKVAPPTANLERPTPHLLKGLVGEVPQPLPPGPQAALCNAFGFGGTNASLLVADV